MILQYLSIINMNMVRIFYLIISFYLWWRLDVEALGSPKMGSWYWVTLPHRSNAARKEHLQIGKGVSEHIRFRCIDDRKGCIADRKQGRECLGASFPYLYTRWALGPNPRRFRDVADHSKVLYNKIGIIWWINNYDQFNMLVEITFQHFLLLHITLIFHPNPPQYMWIEVNTSAAK